MAVTIRNKRIEERLRSLCDLRGEGPSATIGRLVDKELNELSSETEEQRFARRRKAMDEWIAGLPPLTDGDRQEMDRIIGDMYDENGLPK